MALPYSPPGLKVTELSTPSVSPSVAPPAVVAVVGYANGTIRRTDAVTLSGTTAVTLPGVTSAETLTSGSIVSVKASDPSVDHGSYTYNTTTGYASAEYTFNSSARTIARVSSGGGGASGASAIPDASTIYVTYTYLPQNYFVAQPFSDLASIEERYGSAYDSSGTVINSPLSFGAMVALENGAREVYCAPLFSLTTPSDPTSTRNQPSSETNAYTTAVWSATLFGLRDFDDINILVPIIGEKTTVLSDPSALFAAVQDHVAYQKDQGEYLFAVIGQDSTQGVTVSASTLRTNSDTLRSRYGGAIAEQMSLVNTTKAGRTVPSTGGTWYVGGQYVAAAVAGLIASQPVSQPITNEFLTGFIENADRRIKSEKLTDGAKGLLVIEQIGSGLKIRHGLTLDNNSTSKREISVVRAKHHVIESLQDTFRSQIVGKVFPAEDAPIVVATAAAFVLESLKSVGDISDSHSIQARTLSVDPTTVELRFSYKPNYPINYINIVFSLDTTNNTITVL